MFVQHLLKVAEIGCMYAATLGCKVCAFWVHVCGNGWMQSMRFLGACMRLLGASLTAADSLPDSR